MPKSIVIKTNISEIRRCSSCTGADAIAFHEKKNKAAGTRLHKTYQEIEVLAQTGRTAVTDIKNKERN